MKKLLAILVAIMLCLGMAAVVEETYTVGICQLVQQPALASVTQSACDVIHIPTDNTAASYTEAMVAFARASGEAFANDRVLLS